MKVAVQLFATLGSYLPPEAVGDSVTLDLPAGTTADDVVRSLGIPDDLECVRVVNGREWPAGYLLADGDVLSLFPPLAGG